MQTGEDLIAIGNQPQDNGTRIIKVGIKYTLTQKLTNQSLSFLKHATKRKNISIGCH